MRMVIASLAALGCLSVPPASFASRLAEELRSIRLDTLLQSSESRTLKAGTPLTVVLKETLRGGREKSGKTVTFSVASDVLAPNGRDVVIKAGTPVFGTVRDSRGAGPFGRAGRLNVTCDYLAAPDGSHIALRPPARGGRVERRGGSASVPALITGIVVCVPATLAAELSINGFSVHGPGFSGESGDSPAPLVIGPALGIAAASLWRGGSAILREGQIFTVELAESYPDGD